ncbi:hypothetical protein ACM46_03865 [Chryseobacterium angstadtii]|uniref:Uncharacterized protein n=2 Tax=Chryseobacterium angstadtii TaxID=558151 RepID=A0A0J7IK29_9FLAO|nr:hypothetical protein ACM46_03865 [Chryseobacterium angstadtii]
MYQDHISIKEYSIAGKVPLRFSPIAYSDITSFYFDPEKNTMVFRTEFESIIKYADFSTKHFTKKQKSDLKNSLNQSII